MVIRNGRLSPYIMALVAGNGFLLLVMVCLQGCGFSPGAGPAALNPTNGIPATATRTPQPTQTATQTQAPSPTPTHTPTPSATPSPTHTHTPTPSPTMPGGGNGLLAIQDCLAWNNCQHAILSLEVGQITPSDRPYLQSEVTNPNTYNYRLNLVDPHSGEKRTVLACPEEMDSCYQHILQGSLNDEWIYIAQKYQERLYDGKQKSDLYRLNTTTWQATLIDQFDGTVFRFTPFPGSNRGLLSWHWSTGHGTKGGLLIYDLETAQSQILSQRNGQFLIFGASQDMAVFWFRISDYCRTELVASDDSRLAQIKDSDGIVGWIDADTFLIFTAANNPPICTRTGIAQANRYGLTGTWTTTQSTSWGMLTPGGEKVFYTSKCYSNGCTQLMMANPDGSEPQLMAESDQRSWKPTISLSPDGTQYLFTWGGEIGVVNVDGSAAKILLSTDGNWQVEGWLAGEP